MAGAALAAMAGGSAAQAPAGQPIDPARLFEVPVDRPWRTCPQKIDRNPRYYPKVAHKLEIEGEAGVQCRFEGDGRAQACVWVSESTPDVGFGETAEKLGCMMKLTLTAPLAEPVVLQIPIKFKLPR